MSSVEYHRAWREKNRDRVRATARRWRAAHLDSERARNLIYYRKIRSENPRLAWARQSLKNAKSRARSRGVPFTVTLSDVLALAVDRCPVPLCGHCTLSFVEESVQRNSPTLDRIEPRLGYAPGNLWVVCFDCNRRMAENSAEELEALAAAKRKAREATAEDGDGEEDEAA